MLPAWISPTNISAGSAESKEYCVDIPENESVTVMRHSPSGNAKKKCNVPSVYTHSMCCCDGIFGRPIGGLSCRSIFMTSVVSFWFLLSLLFCAKAVGTALKMYSPNVFFFLGVLVFLFFLKNFLAQW